MPPNNPLLEAARKAGLDVRLMITMPFADRAPEGPPAPEPEGGSAGEAPDPDRAWHGENFACVCWFGRRFTFNETQRQVISVLWGAWVRGVPWMSQGDIMEAIDLPRHTRLKDVFAGSPAWKTMIQGGHSHGEALGTYGLVRPTPTTTIGGSS